MEQRFFNLFCDLRKKEIKNNFQKKLKKLDFQKKFLKVRLRLGVEGQG
jgi:hypothetical protein